MGREQERGEESANSVEGAGRTERERTGKALWVKKQLGGVEPVLTDGSRGYGPSMSNKGIGDISARCCGGQDTLDPSPSIRSP
jgi:hypothetical protein